MSSKTTLLWFRQDLRLTDNLALLAAIDRGNPIVPVYIWAPDEEGDWPPGGASRWWIHRSLTALDASLRERGSQLIIRKGPTLATLRELIDTCDADTVHWNRRYEPAIIERDKQVKTALKDDGVEVASFNSALLREPWEVQTKTGTPYKVYTPFWRMCHQLPLPDRPTEAPSKIAAPKHWPKSLRLDELELNPKIAWDAGLEEAWTPGEAGAHQALDRFLNESINDYAEGRDLPAQNSTSSLSPYLHHGEIGPRQIWHAVEKRAADERMPIDATAKQKFLNEIGWREFAYHVLYHFPHTPTQPLQEKYAAFPWADVNEPEHREALKAWRKGQTGYPIIDAGMRQLYHTGWMHNRVRMIVASLLVKNLLITWEEGARWFWDTLVDADLASNTLGWQWAGGCGADAAPYFRIFNPTTQGEKFDKAGVYTKRWCPELEPVPEKFLYKPWEMKRDLLNGSDFVLGEDYPEPIVDHKATRERALDALSQIKKTD